MHFVPRVVISQSEKPARCLLEYSLEILPRGGHGRGKGPVVRTTQGTEKVTGMGESDKQTRDLVRCLPLLGAAGRRWSRGRNWAERQGRGRLRQTQTTGLLCLIPAYNFLWSRGVALTPGVTGLH